MHKFMIFSWALLSTLFLDKCYYLISVYFKEQIFLSEYKKSSDY